MDRDIDRGMLIHRETNIRMAKDYQLLTSNTRQLAGGAALWFLIARCRDSSQGPKVISAGVRQKGQTHRGSNADLHLPQSTLKDGRCELGHGEEASPSSMAG